MTEKVLFEFRAIQTESSYKYKHQHGKRAFILRAPNRYNRNKTCASLSTTHNTIY